ncbi:MAG TPA: hypothetical protein VKZ18_18660 [Polyangia bacterium]|nr:hypothetical protein [Polyangia bacterium]
MKSSSVKQATALLWLAALSAGCAGPAALTAPPTSACGDQCSAMSCPAGTHCTLTSNCAAVCQQDQLAPR